MSVIAKAGGGGDYTPPPTGVHPALCVDVVDLGMQKTPFKDEKTGEPKIVHQIQIYWQLHPEDDEGNVLKRDDGLPFLATKFYTLSLHEKANLRQDLDNWRGKPFTEEQLEEGFDVEKLIGAQCQLTLVEKKKKNGDTFVAVAGVAPKHRRDPEIDPSPDFKRQLEIPGGRDTRSPAAEDADTPSTDDAYDGGPFEDDDDLPF
jgi:hypothetical protein